MSVAAPSIVIVGESPPAGAPPDFSPFDCASGTRLATILGLRDRATMLAHIPRDNLFAATTGIDGAPAWNFERSMDKAADVWCKSAADATHILLGRRVADAFLIPRPVPDKSIRWAPAIGSSWKFWRGAATDRGRCIYIPHPSGASTTYTAEVKRDVRQMLLPELIIGVPSLRPWHFNLADPVVLHDLAVAVSPLCPALGAAALVWADGQRRMQEARQSTPLLSRINSAMDANDMSPRTVARRHFEEASDAVTSADGRYLLSAPKAPWDQPMSHIAAALIRHDGGRILGAAWDPARVAIKAGKPGWLTAMAVQYSSLNTCSRHVARATLARYMEAGI